MPPATDQLGACARADFGIMTIPKPDSAPGGPLVRTVQGDWVPVKALPGAFILNIEDKMARWTND